MSVGGHSQAGPNRTPDTRVVFEAFNELESLLSEASHAIPQHWILFDEACEVALPSSTRLQMPAPLPPQSQFVVFEASGV